MYSSAGTIMGYLPDTLPFSKKPLPVRVMLSYIFDYVILIALVAGFFILDLAEPFHQHFSLQNYNLQYPFAVNERVPMALAILISGGLPILFIAFYTLVIDGIFSHNKDSASAAGRRKLWARYTWRERLWELNCGILGLVLSQAAAFVITAALKNACGKPRPDLIARCLPRPGSVDPPVFGLSDSSICTQPDHAILKDGFRSFPSGHSSAAFAGLFYLSLYLSGKLHIMDNRGEVWKTVIVMVPSLGAALIAISRIVDARHHPFDVIAGSLLGIAVAWASYRQYFPSISEPMKKGRAHPIRSWGTRTEEHPHSKLVEERDGDEEDAEDVEIPTHGQRFAQHQQSGSVGAPQIPPDEGGREGRRQDVERRYSSSSGPATPDDYEIHLGHRRRAPEGETTAHTESRFTDTAYHPPTSGPITSSPPPPDPRPLSPYEPLRKPQGSSGD